MRKIIAVFLWAWIPFFWQPLWGQSPGVGVQAAHNQKHNAKFGDGTTATDQRGTQSSPIIVETHSRPDSPEESARHKAENDTKEYRDGWTFKFTAINAIIASIGVALTFLLICIGWRGVKAANSTLAEIKTQAMLMADQAEIMQVPFRSWVALDNWKAILMPQSDPPTERRLRVMVDVINGTDFPITITEGRIKIKIAGGQGYVMCEVFDRSFLTPDAPHPIDVWVPITEGHAETYVENAFYLPIEGQFSHFGPLGEKTITTQSFSGFLECGVGHRNRFSYELHMNPVRNEADSKGEEKAN